jgi:hypothetical protein
MLTYHELTPEEYVDRLVATISGVESLLTRAVRPDRDDANYTIGFGYTFTRNDNVALWQAAGISLSPSNLALLAQIDAAPARDKNALAASFDRIISRDEARALLRQTYLRYEGPAASLNMPLSLERVAFVAVTYNRGVPSVRANMAPFTQAVARGDRAEVNEPQEWPRPSPTPGWRGRIHVRVGQLFLVALPILLLLAHETQAASGPCYRFADFNPEMPQLNRAAVCKAILQNLNAFCEEPPMVCELKIHSKLGSNLRQPEWRRVSPTPTAKDLEQFFSAPETALGRPAMGQQDWDRWRPEIQIAIERNTLTVDEAEVDLLNQGVKRRTFRVQTGECTNKNHATEDSDHSLMYQTQGIAINFAADVFFKEPEIGPVWVATGPVFTFQERTYSYAIGLDTVGVVRFGKQRRTSIVGRKQDVCSIQMIYGRK